MGREDSVGQFRLGLRDTTLRVRRTDGKAFHSAKRSVGAEASQVTACGAAAGNRVRGGYAQTRPIPRSSAHVRLGVLGDTRLVPDFTLGS